MNKIFKITFVPVFLLLAGVGIAQQSKLAAQVLTEKQPIADQGNGYYLNRILAGDYGDPTIVLVDKTYTLAKSYGYGIIIWQSGDLVNLAAFLTLHLFVRGLGGGCSFVFPVQLR
jgi:hypothetical protein